MTPGHNICSGQNQIASRGVGADVGKEKEVILEFCIARCLDIRIGQHVQARRYMIGTQRVCMHIMLCENIHIK